MSRFRVVLAVVFALALLAAGCGSERSGVAGGGGGGAAGGAPAAGDETSSPAEPAEGEPLKIGAPIALTGPIAAQAEEMVNGYNLYLEQHDGALGGVPTEVLFEDTEADPNTVIAKTRKLIEQDQVHLIGGGALALESLAIIDVADQNNIAFVTPISSADDLTQRDLRPIFARPNMTSSQPNLAFGQWVFDNLGYRRVAVIAQDYAYGWESAGGFQHAFEQAGGDVVQKVWVPLDASDLTPFVRQLQAGDVDAVYAMLVGAHIPRFVKTYKDFGLDQQAPLIGGPDMADEDALRAMGDEEVGLVTVHEYAASLPTAEEFVTAYQEAYDAVPSYWAESTYITAQWLDQTIAGLIESEGLSPAEVPQWIRDNPEDFITAFAEVEVDSPHGHLTLDDNHNVITDVHIFEVTAPDTKEVLETIPQVSQFGSTPPDEFLAQPVFSREFPE
jgi:branched-chain amino acid transport system substrate-binding protein